MTNPHAEGRDIGHKREGCNYYAVGMCNKCGQDHTPKPRERDVEKAIEVVSEYYSFPIDEPDVTNFDRMCDCVPKSIVKDICRLLAASRAYSAACEMRDGRGSEYAEQLGDDFDKAREALDAELGAE